MFKDKQEGDMLMDAPETDSWHCLLKYAADRDYWRVRVRAMRQPRIVNVKLGPTMEEGKDCLTSICSTGPRAITKFIQ